MSIGIVLFMVTMTCCTQTEQEMLSPPKTSWERGMEIIRTQGAQAGIEYFRNQTIKSEDIRDLYGLAWSLWEAGEIGNSRELCLFILSRDGNSKRLRANCHYLLGHIEKFVGRFDESRYRFYEAVTLYSILELNSELFESYCGLASVSLLARDLSNVDFYLKKALEFNKKAKKNLGYFFSLSAIYSFKRRDFVSALEFSYRSKEEFLKIGDILSINAQLSSISFYSIILGDFETGFKIAKEVDSSCRKHNLSKQAYYNLVNLYLLKKCLGDDLQKELQEITHWISENNDQRLEEILDFAMNWSCSPIKEKTIEHKESRRKERTSDNPRPPDIPDDPPPNGGN